jgi:hypothetical protein
VRFRSGPRRCVLQVSDTESADLPFSPDVETRGTEATAYKVRCKGAWQSRTYEENLRRVRWNEFNPASVPTEELVPLLGPLVG